MRAGGVFFDTPPWGTPLGDPPGGTPGAPGDLLETLSRGPEQGSSPPNQGQNRPLGPCYRVYRPKPVFSDET